MAFDILLAHAVGPGDDSCGEQGKTVIISRRNDETIVFFHLDNDEIRLKLGLKQSPCCDNLIFFQKKEAKPLLVFVELKGKRGVRHATQQLLAAYRKICPANSAFHGRAKALIVSSSSSTMSHKELQRELLSHKLELFFSAGNRKSRCDLRSLSGLEDFFQ